MKAKTLNEAIKQIKRRDFNFIKVELEAVTRIDNNDEYCSHCDEGIVTCEDCEGEGEVRCDQCDGAGERQLKRRKTGEPFGKVVECPTCDAEGRVQCSVCDGNYNVTCPECHGNWEGEDVYERINDQLESEIKQQFGDILVYSNVYEDSTVDLEWTFTIMIEYAKHLPKIIDIFKGIITDNKGELPCDHDFTTSNAGMHISIMSDSDPHESKLGVLDWGSFSSHVNEVMLALLVEAASNDLTRQFYYRELFAERDQKYYAICGKEGNFLEYRIFDTCYDRPEYILEDVKTIARTLTLKGIKYYELKNNRKRSADLPKTSDDAAKVQNKSSDWGHDKKYKLSDLFDEKSLVDRLIKEISALLGITLDEAKQHLKPKLGDLICVE